MTVRFLFIHFLEMHIELCITKSYFCHQVQYFTDATVGWENTLAALDMGVGGPNMVKEMDPDAPCRTGKKLHDLDMEDENRLLKVRKLLCFITFMFCVLTIFSL